VTNHQQQRQPQLGPAQTLALAGPVYQGKYRMQNQLEWNRSPSLSIDQFHGVDHLADIVYERLLTRPGMPLESYGRIFTLPDDFESKRPQRQLPSTLVKTALQSVVGTTEQRLLGQEEFANGEIFPEIEEESDNTLADEINEYLLSMNLDGLSEQDVEYLDQNTNVTLLSHIEGPPGESTGFPNQTYVDPSEQPRPSKPRESTIHRIWAYGRPGARCKYGILRGYGYKDIFQHYGNIPQCFGRPSRTTSSLEEGNSILWPS